MDPHAFLDALISPSAHIEVPDNQRIFEPFLGSWALVVRWYGRDGNLVRQEDGEWHFSRVLEGRAIQDVWIVPPRGKRDAGAYEYGTSLRFYDASVDGWRSTWIGPMHGAVLTFIARQKGEAVVLETTKEIQPARRWSFRDISAAGFNWIHEEAAGDVWRIVQTFAARRLDVATAPPQ
ncbi:hypothetical protein [Pelagibacterium limicola]|uniref:hypothetical protein n=1 Tax=Pelagibacterium limicola TaxID=2791022 RepID=UPI0018AF8E7D|nr:hypothetical protein [Pelagibacterium limicola]